MQSETPITVEIFNITASNNKANYGGFLYGNFLNVTLASSNFSSNQAKKGGVLSINTTTLDINKCNFSNNYASMDGGVLNILDYYQINISNSKISNNSVIKSFPKAEGGVIRAESKY